MATVKYDSYKVEKRADYVRLSAEALVELENVHDNESFAVAIPEYWKNRFLSKININNYDIYYLYSCTIPANQVNSITNHKKIWGLGNITPGLYHNSYFNDVGKVYFGIKEIKEEKNFLDTTANILLLPRGENVAAEKIFNIFEMNRFDFNAINGFNFVFAEIQRLLPTSILLNYAFCHDLSLNIYGQGVEDFFDNVDLPKED